ncbi:MAG: phosphoribosylamine--glycine ligase [Fidelibacterota bacterium]
MKNRILVVGSGAREHAIIRSLVQSHQEKEIYCLASNLNPGIAELCDEIFTGRIDDDSFVRDYARESGVFLAVIGPENPLAQGVADALWTEGIGVVGPKKDLAAIETSKGFTRDLMKEYKIPGSPEYKRFNSMDGVSEYLEYLGEDYVVKYDGLAGGKGVKVSGDHLFSHADGLAYCETLVHSGGGFVIEEKLVGQEFSLMSFCDGIHLQHMPAVQDHKRAYDGDTGPNTGGMGTYSDANHSLPFLNNEDIAQARQMNTLTAQALHNKFGEGYKGILYGGFMATADGVKLIEYNARFGDPEAMNVLSILESDLIDIFWGISDGTLDTIDIQFRHQATVCKYAVPEGYPEDPVKGKPIDVSGVENTHHLFYASVDIQNGHLVECGSRTVAAVGIADNITEAEKIAEKEISAIKGPLFHRTDIGKDNLVSERVNHMKMIRT